MPGHIIEWKLVESAEFLGVFGGNRWEIKVRGNDFRIWFSIIFAEGFVSSVEFLLDGIEF